MNLSVIGAILLPFVGSIPIPFLTKKNIPSWYKYLKKPSWHPPTWILGPVWSFLYASMGYASYLVYNEGGDNIAMVLYCLQLLLNWAWTPIFFGQHKVKLAAYEISALWIAVAACGIKFFSINQVAGFLFIPYQAWVTFAAALNFSIWRLNEDNLETVKKN